jgi:hypothetical protein
VRFKADLSTGEDNKLIPTVESDCALYSKMHGVTFGAVDQNLGGARTAQRWNIGCADADARCGKAGGAALHACERHQCYCHVGSEVSKTM